MEKECRRCHITKPAGDFYANDQKKDGLSSYCRVCTLAEAKARYVPKPPRERPPEGLKRCYRCKENKPLAMFARNRSHRDGLQEYCRPCQVAAVTASRQKNPESHRRCSKNWREACVENTHRHYENSIRHRIGKHYEHGTYARLLQEQKGKCAICQKPTPGTRLRRFHVDHCHTTLRIRGLLCHNCNALLGHAYDNPAILDSAKAYLLKHTENDESLAPAIPDPQHSAEGS